VDARDKRHDDSFKLVEDNVTIRKKAIRNGQLFFGHRDRFAVLRRVGC
jgi:hypothetical protein